ncbi:MAG TPA: hypothetical protein VKA21_11605 [Candidatus Binatia bacterium]|nr:hypothetical protein [Candidatus Binatia bacterium]
MAPIIDAAKVASGGASQDLAQFEPDPDGQGSVEPIEVSAANEPGDSQWVVWPDADEEADWAADELTQLTAAPRIR